jgi:peptidoglycan/LPS O-acetylase OafA/YrhL
LAETSRPVVERLEGRENLFNFMRVVLASLVILSHAPQLMDGDEHRELLMMATRGNNGFGEFAVDCFFIISGLLITHSWVRSRDLTDYLRKRCLRILPGFIVASLVSAFIVGALGAAHPGDYFHSLGVVGPVRDAVTLRGPVTPPVFQGLPHALVNGSLWTIRYEFLCYVLLALLGIAGLVNRKWPVLVLFLLCFAGYAALHAMGIQELHPKIWLGFLGRAEQWPRFLTFFLAGSVLYLYRDILPFNRKFALAATGIVLLTMFVVHWYPFVFPVVGTYALVALALYPAKRLQRFGERMDLSYGIYLYGWPVQILLVWYKGRNMDPFFLFALTLLLTIPFAMASWFLVEKPFIKLKRRPAAAPVVKEKP